MISTGKAGRAVAVVFGGSHDGTIVRIANESDGPEAVTPRRPLHEVLDESDFLLSSGKVKKLTLLQQLRIEMAMEAAGELEDEEPESEDEKAPRGKVGKRVIATYRAKSRSEFRLDDGKMIVLPSRDPERVFVAGKSGSGKSFFTASYMREYSEMFPERVIYLFSTHSEEKAYSEIEHEAIPLDDDFIANPPTLESLGGTLEGEDGPSGCLCVFDDCDNLQNKRLLKAVDAVNADLISNGRKYNIHVVSLNHQLMEHSRTRNQLNEANRVVFFPQGSPYHNQRYLKVYAGLDGKWVKKILDERSRWICLDLRVPLSYVTENAVVIVGTAMVGPSTEYVAEEAEEAAAEKARKVAEIKALQLARSQRLA
jgi:hypothetical protein